MAIKHLTDGACAENGSDHVSILLLEDSDLDAELIASVLEDAGMACEIDRVMTREAFVASITERCHAIILADYILPTFDGFGALTLAKAKCPAVPFVFVSGTLGEDVAVETLKNGATDYVTKQRLDRLPRVIVRALAEAQTNARKNAAEKALQEANETLEARVAERTRELHAVNAELQRQNAERERVEDALRQSQRLEVVGQLTSGVAHDFNNLLTVILGNIEILNQMTSDAHLRGRLDMMHDAAGRGAKLTAQLLAFSRRQRLEPTPVQLNETVTSMRDLLQSSIGGAVQIEAALQPDLWPAFVDATQIELVILNLAINARDAMAVGGSLTIETRNVNLTEPPNRPEEPPPGSYVMVAVSDTGSGIPSDILTRVFEPFFTTKEVGKGSGLGLAQVYGFAKQSGGGVCIDTYVGEGTSVKVYLPPATDETSRCAIAVPVTRSMDEVKQSTRRPILLIIDDDPAVREITAIKLSQAGYVVREAESGVAGLTYLEADARIDGVVIDFAMPGMNGAEVAAEIRTRWPHLALLFVTGFADTKALQALGSVGEEHIVQKPFLEGELERKVAAVIEMDPWSGTTMADVFS